MRTQRWDRDTWLEDEEAAYPNGGQTRRGRAVFPDGVTRAVRVGIPDTYFSIPAHGRIKGRYVAGHVSMETEDGSDVDVGQSRWLAFRPFARYREETTETTTIETTREETDR